MVWPRWVVALEAGGDGDVPFCLFGAGDRVPE